MALRKYPRSQMHLNIERINSARFQITRLAHRFALRTIDACAGDLRDRTVGSHIRQPREPISQRRRCRSLQPDARAAKYRNFILERRRIVNQAERVDWPRIAQQLSPPEAR